MFKNFQVPGIVNNQDYKNNAEADLDNKFYSLGKWLKANDIKAQKQLKEMDKKFEGLRTEDALISVKITTYKG